MSATSSAFSGPWHGVEAQQLEPHVAHLSILIRFSVPAFKRKHFYLAGFLVNVGSAFQ